MGSDLNQSWMREQYLNERVRDLESELERWRKREEGKAICCLSNESKAARLEAENAELRAKVKRYEASGPVLMTVDLTGEAEK